MKTSLKVIVTLFVVGIILVGVWLSLDSDTKCKLIYGKNICNFYKMMDTQPLISNFAKMMNLCREMSDVPKKDSCFEFIAETFTLIDVEKAQQACEEIKGFNNVHSKEDCHIKIQKPIEERLAESAIIEFMEARMERNKERALIWLTDNAREQYSQPGLTLIGTSNPHFASYKILEIEKLDAEKFKFQVRINEEYTGEGMVGYFDETLVVIKSNGGYKVDSVERSEYISLRPSEKSIKLASFNLLHLGWDNDKDIDKVANILARYDIIALQEVMNTEIMNALESKLDSFPINDIPIDWDYIISDQKLGRSSYKEYYAIAFRTDKISYLPETKYIYNDIGDKFQREPFYASFKSGNFDFTLVTMHLIWSGSGSEDKTKRNKELDELAVAFQKIQDEDLNENDVILVGDFNMKPSETHWINLKAVDTMTYLIREEDEALTTIGKNGMSNLYDNIWFQKKYTNYEYANESGVYLFFNDFYQNSTNKYENARAYISDHVPVWSKFKTNLEDDD